MAADQRRKRLHGASIGGYGSREQSRAKRKNFGLVHNDLNMRSHISVEWDVNQKTVVAKREQVGISWRQMRPFVNFIPVGHNVLADVVAIPQEIFNLDNLTDVLSYEVWKTHLSENERNFLMHFLPIGVEPHQILQELLAGDNFHFGNPFFKWGASLCSGDLHPDMIVEEEQHLKSQKLSYYSELHNYHNEMIEYLINLKERWESCKDPEKEILQKIRRSTNDSEKRMSSNVNESRVYDHDENVTATSESGSGAAEEKACSSDNQISSVRMADRLQKRALEKGSVKGKPRILLTSSDEAHKRGVMLKKGDRLHKRNIQSSDVDKYMSCIKISKKQHELVKGMKQSGNSIQSRSLNRVLGNLDNINVQPYEVFIKEEQKKLRDHWLKLVNKDLPVAFANWTQRQIQRHAVMNSLVVEIKDKSEPLLEDEDDGSLGSKHDQKYDASLNDQSSSEDDEDNASTGDKLQDWKYDGGLNNQSSSEVDEDSITRSAENQSPHDSYLADEEFNPMNIDSEKDTALAKLDEVSQDDDASQNKYDEEEFNPMNMNSEKITALAKSDEVSQDDDASQNQYDDEEFNPMSMDSEKNTALAKPDEFSQDDDASQNQYDDEEFNPMSMDSEKNTALAKPDEFSQDDDASQNQYDDEEFNPMSMDSEKNTALAKPDDFSQDDDASQNQYDDKEFNPMSMDSEKSTAFAKADDFSHDDDASHNVVALCNKTECSKNVNTRDVPISEGVPLSSGSGVWQAVEMSHSYYDATMAHEYTANGLSLANPQITGEQRTRLIDLESNLHREETSNGLLHRHSDGSFGSYPNQDRNDLLQSIFKGEGMLPFHHEQKGAGLDLQTANNVIMGGGQFPGHFKEPLQTSLTLDQLQRRPGEVYMPENMSQNIYSDRGRYLIHRYDPLSAVNMADWAVNAGRVPAPSQSHISTGEFMGQHWLPSEHQVRGAWNGSDSGTLSSQTLGTVGNPSDQSLFSVLSQCNQLQSASRYDLVRHGDQFLNPRSYGVADAVTPRINAVVSQTPNPLDYLGGREAPNSLMPEDMAWMNLPHQSPTLHDQMGKPYLRSWNR